MTNCLSLIKQRFSSMSPAEKKIAACILQDPHQVINNNINMLAAKSGVSISSVVNFSVSLGFTGFSDLKINLARGLSDEQNITFDDVTQADGPKEAMRKLIANANASFESTFAAMGDELLHAAQWLLQAPHIQIYGAGSSLPVAYDLHYRLIRLGLPAQMLPDPLLACLGASQIPPQSTVIAISHKGRTANTLLAAEIAKKRGAKIIALTSYAVSPLTKLSDLCLISVSGEALQYREAVVARLSQLLIIDSLCAYIAAQRGLLAMEHLDNEIEMLELHRKSMSDQPPQDEA